MSYPTRPKPLWYLIHTRWLAWYQVQQANATLTPNVPRGTCMAFPASQHPPMAKQKFWFSPLGRHPNVVRGTSEVHQVDLAATLRHLGRAGDVLVVLLVAAARRVAAVRGEAAVLDLGALRHRGGCSAM